MLDVKLVYFFQFCRLGRLSHEVGWKYQDVVKTLEDKRKARSALYYETKKGLEVSIFSLILQTRKLMPNLILS